MSRTSSTTPSTTVRDAMLSTPKLCGPATTVSDVRRLFADHHVHAVLVVDGDQLTAVVEPVDLTDSLTPDLPAAHVGRLEGRVIGPDADLDRTREQMATTGRRRLAVTDEAGRLLGLLALKRTGAGFCSTDGVLARAADRRAT